MMATIGRSGVVNRRRCRWAFAIITTSTALACATVPDLKFDEPEGGPNGPDGSSDARDARDARDDTAPPNGGACPGTAPPASQGVCCGAVLCLKCNAAKDCRDCEKARCSNGEVCCRSGDGMRCESTTKCQ